MMVTTVFLLRRGRPLEPSWSCRLRSCEVDLVPLTRHGDVGRVIRTSDDGVTVRSGTLALICGALDWLDWVNSGEV